MARKFSIWGVGNYAPGTDVSAEIDVPVAADIEGKGANVELWLHNSDVGRPDVAFTATLELLDEDGITWRTLMSASYDNGWDNEQPLLEMQWTGLATIAGRRVRFVWERRSSMRLTAQGLAVTLV